MNLASKPDIVIHLAATHLPGVEKFVALGAIYAYPKFAPEETNAPYGLANLLAKLTRFDCRPCFSGCCVVHL